MRVLGTIGVVVLFGFSFSLPFSAGAVTVDELTAQVNALLQQVQSLQSQVGGTTSTTATASNSSAFCPGIGRSLKSGSTGDDVTRLQQFLAQDSAIYPEAKATSYYGALTEAAVKRWQTKFHIVSSGTPATTGYGLVGPRTAAAIAIVCGGGSYNGITSAGTTGTGITNSPVGGFIKVTPIQGAAPLTVSIEATINTTQSCSAATYILDFGDQSTPQILPVSAGICAQLVNMLTHTYISEGTFTITLSAGGHKTTASVQVGGTSTQTQSGAASVSITDNAFTPKVLTVQPGTKVTWTNAGTMSHSVTADNDSFYSATLQHGQTYSQTFTVAGTYPYYCAFHGGVGGIGMSGSIVVTSSANTNTNTTNTTTNTATTSANTYYGTTVASTPETVSYGKLAVTPGISGNALMVQVQFDLPGCPSFALDWGDDSSPVTSGATQCSQNMVLNHTYVDSGSYTIELDRGARIDRASVVLWGN